MLQRFVAAAAIASVVIACGAFAIMLIPAFKVQNFYPVTAIWCFAPLVWGIWAILTPKSWVPQRLPNWGALLGLIAAVIVVFVVDVPSRVFATSVAGLRMSADVPPGARILAVVIVAAFYYVLWMFVRAVYRSLTAATSAGKAGSAASGKQ